MIRRFAAFSALIRVPPSFAIDLISASARTRRRAFIYFVAGASTAIMFASLVLTPVATYAAQAQQDEGAIAPRRSSIVSVATPTHQQASSGQVPHGPGHGLKQINLKQIGNEAGDNSSEVLQPATPVGGMVRLSGHMLPVLSKATLIVPAHGNASAAKDNQPLTLTIVLRRDDQAGFERYLREVYNPRSPHFRHFLARRQISDRFGPSRKSYKAVLSYVQENGFRLVQGSANRLTLTFRGTRSQAEHAFAVHIRNYALGGRSFIANDQPPAVPVTLAEYIEAIAGLSNLALPARPTHTAEPPVPDSLFGAAPSVENTKAVCLFSSPYPYAGGGLLFGLQAFIGGFLGLSVAQTAAAALATGTAVGLAFATLCSGLLAGIAGSYAGCVAGAQIYGSHVWTTDPQCADFAKNGFPTSSSVTPVSYPQSSLTSDPTPNPQKIGLLEFDTFNSADVLNWLGLVNPQAGLESLKEVAVNGGVLSPGPNESEVLLDIDTVMLLANLPEITYTVYDAPAGTSFETMFNAMIGDGDTVISNSWSQCEDQTIPAEADSINSILETAAASGISVFNGTGDSGSTCLDGSANTIGVPADSPNATAVGGTTPMPGRGLTYGTETWWNGTTDTPPTGQGGYGVSKFFARPSFQIGLTSSTMRSIPDVVVDADPGQGVEICQADNGGCPAGKLFGGTSMATPEWAAYTADLNRMFTSNVGNVDTVLYPLAGTAAFHSAASMSSNFAHVGLGSPDFLQLRMALTGLTAGPVSTAQSVAVATGGNLDGSNPADGKTAGFVQADLLDANGFPLHGKTVSLTANSGSSAAISPASAVSDSDGNVVFQVTDLKVDDVSFTVTDKTDDITLAQTPKISFVTPPAASAGIEAFPTSVTNNGTSATTITVTLEDALGRPTPGKQVTVSQGSGNSVIKGPNPAVTNSGGQIEFTASDLASETVTYMATDVTDGNLAFPGSAIVTFSGTPSNGCVNGSPTAASGFGINPFATGFTAGKFFYGDVNWGCSGAWGMAFDAAKNLYVADFVDGNIYKFGTSGGVAGPATLLTTISPTAGGLTIGKDGNLYVGIAASSSSFFQGSILQIDPATGKTLKTIATDMTCPYNLATDPLSGDLFVDDGCSGDGSDNASIWRISNLSGASPTVTVYATLLETPNFQLAFAPGGTLYASTGFNGFIGELAKVSGTDQPSPPTVTNLDTSLSNAGLAVQGEQSDGDGQMLITAILARSGFPAGLTSLDLTSAELPVPISPLVSPGAGNVDIIGPDGCLYAAQNDTVYRITGSNGTCPFTTEAGASAPTLSLTPAVVTPNPAQGGSQTFLANFHFISVPAETPVFFQVTGANPQFQIVPSNFFPLGEALFSYTAVNAGQDTIVALATVGKQTFTSNPVMITWTPGQHTTFLSLNLSATSVIVKKTVTVTASLSDISASPVVPVKDASIQFTIEGSSCTATTDAKGNASCSVAPSFVGTVPLTAIYAGSTEFVGANATVGFNIMALPTFVPTFTPAPSATPTVKPTPTPTLTPIPTPIVTHTPIPTHTPMPTRTAIPTPTPTAPECIATTPKPTVPVPTPTPLPGHPRITSVTSPVLAGASFLINGSGFTKGSEVNFFVSTSTGPVNKGPLKPNAASFSPTELTVPVPATITLGQGFVSVVVVNTDEGFVQSNPGFALLQGSAAAGLPSITGLDGNPLAATSLDPDFAVANVETTLLQGGPVVIDGNGFDTTHGVAVDVFCACPETGGKVTQFLIPGNPGLKPDSITFPLPAAAVTGPGSVIVSNSAGGTYSAKSEAVSVPLGARINVTKVTQSGDTVTVDGTGFSTRTVINLFNTQAGKTVNLGGLNHAGAAKIPLTLISSNEFTFTVPADAVAGPAFIEALNPPFLDYTSSGNDPCGAFTLK